jgi:dCMP deaminase
LEAIRLRSSCDRGKSGALIVFRNRIVATGYVGSPPGQPHCDEVGHLMRDNHCIRTTHAEMNAILQAAKFGVPIENSIMYCTMIPCYTCAKAIVGTGIFRVVAVYDYHESEDTRELFESSKILFDILHPGEFCYDCRSLANA